MKVLFSIIVLLLMLPQPCSNAQPTNDSTATIISKWNKHETHLFEITEQEYIITNRDTTTTVNYSRKFTVEVNDSTEHFYLLKYCDIDSDTARQHLAIDSISLKLMTNHNGALIKVINWEEYLPIYDNDNQAVSDAIFPYALLITFNGKNLKLKHKYKGVELVSGSKLEIQADSVIAHTEMIATREFTSNEANELITINTTTKYTFPDDLTPIGVSDYFTQVIDSSKGWAIATYIIREFTDGTMSIIRSKNIQLLD